jgi:hypothetical protein
VFFEGIPHLHVEDRFSAYSQCCQLLDRSMNTQIRALKLLWIDKYPRPKRLTADPEYDTPAFQKFCENTKITLSIVATEAHNQNGIIEAGNRILRMFFNRIRIAEPQLSLTQAKAPRRTNFGWKSYRLTPYGTICPLSARCKTS